MILFEEQTQRNEVLGHSVITDVFTHKCGRNIFFEKKGFNNQNKCYSIIRTLL